MSEDDAALLAMHDAKMSVDSIASMFRRSTAWTGARLDELLAQREDAGRPALEPHDAAQVVEAWGLARGRCTASAVGLAVVPLPAPRRDVIGAYRGVTAPKLRYSRWFLAAGWRVGEVAQLFDVEPEDLREALA